MLVTTNTVLLEQLADPTNQRVWEEFDGRYRPVIAAFARRLGLSYEDADEVAQETMARFAEDYRAGKYQRDRGRLRSWIFGIARLRALDAKRVRARRREDRGESALEQQLDDASITAVFEAEWRAALVRQAFTELRATSKSDPKTLRAVELLALGGKSAGEVAAELGMPVSAVHLAKHRALKRLRTILEELERDW